MTLDAFTVLRHRLLREAQRRTTCWSEAEDLVQESLLVAWRAGQFSDGAGPVGCESGRPRPEVEGTIQQCQGPEWAAEGAKRSESKEWDPGDRSPSEAEAWLRGVVRNLAAQLARTEGRRRRRDQEWTERHLRPHVPAPEVTVSASLPALPPSLRAVALLALAGCSRQEVQWLLHLEPTALRQRIAALRRRAGATPELARANPVAHGQRRPWVLDAVRRQGHWGSHDPDGHCFIVGCSQNRGPRQP